jgi:hypothetical protein
MTCQPLVEGNTPPYKIKDILNVASILGALY